MRRPAQNVKQLARLAGIWHRIAMTTRKDDKVDPKAERLAAALRANLRLRKSQARSLESEAKPLLPDPAKK
jgi:hypothetical protein